MMPGLIYTFDALFGHFGRDTESMAKATGESTHAIYSGELAECCWLVSWSSSGIIDFTRAEYVHYDSLEEAREANPGVPVVLK